MRKESNQPCPCGTSSDACTYFYNDDGSTAYHCFRGDCARPKGQVEKGTTKGKKELKKYKVRHPIDRPQKWSHTDGPLTGSLSDIQVKVRGLNPISLKKYGIKMDDDGALYFPTTEGKLFGQDIFGAGSAKTITICSGSLDAPSAYQLSGGFPAVSVDSDTTALKQCKEQFDYLNSFKEIVFAFDNDKSASKVVQDCAELFLGKSKIMSMTYKDANEYLTETQNGRDKWQKDFFQASPVKVSGIIPGTELFKQLLDKPKVQSYSWPWEGLNKKTNGWRLGEMIAIGAGTGQGKTLFMTHIADHILKTTDFNIGVIFLEDPNLAAAERFVSVRGAHPYHLIDINGEPEYPFSNDEYVKYAEETVNSGRLFFFNNEEFAKEQSVIDKITMFVKAYDCKVLFLDHISFIVGIDATDGDERRKLDQMATTLKGITVNEEVALFVNAHFKRLPGTPHEEGAEASLSDFRSSGAIAQLANTAIGLERNQQAEDDVERRTTRVRSMKCRFTGRTGLASTLEYCEYPYTWNEV